MWYLFYMQIWHHIFVLTENPVLGEIYLSKLFLLKMFFLHYFPSAENKLILHVFFLLSTDLKKIQKKDVFCLKWWCLQMPPWSQFSRLKHQVCRNQSSSRSCWTAKGMAVRIRCVTAWEFILLVCKTNAGSEGNHYIQPNRRKEKDISALRTCMSTDHVSTCLKCPSNAMGKFLCLRTFCFRIQSACVHLTTI